MKKIILITTLFICCLQCGMLSLKSQILYGVTEYGGSSDSGVIFSYDPTSSTYKKLWDFQSATGGVPNSRIMQASNGKIYGATYWGGNSGYGVIFSFDPTSSVYTKLKDFSGAIGTNNPAPDCPIQASDGKLYGMTSGGGIFGFGDGTIYSLDPATSTYTKLKDFDGMNDGSNPLGRFIQASDGKLYGMTYRGGSNYGGVIFSFDPASSIFTKLRDFNNTDGAQPSGSLLQASDGKLYGMTSNADFRPYGVLFSYDVISSTYTMLKDFNDNISGNGPLGSLIQASDGKLYGMTANGGSSDSGVIFSYDPTSSTYKKLWDFQSATGAVPHGSLMQASNGKLYGTTRSGGINYRGVIFSFDPATGTYTKLKDFLGSDGAYPSLGSALIEVAQSSGPSQGPGAWTRKADFPGKPRSQASAFSINGKMYVGLGYGQENNNRVFYLDFWEYNPATGMWTKKADFPGEGRFDAVDFAIGNKGYVGTGSKGVYNLAYFKDFWEYDATADKWTRKADFAGVARTFAAGFSIGSKGYIGTGYGDNYQSDFWEYDPALDKWTRKADFGGGPRSNPTGFSIGDKGYIGTGYAGSHFNDFWEYDPATDTWSRKADFGGSPREWATGFSIGDKGYLGTGYAGTYFKDFWQYDQVNNTWTRKADFDGGARNGATGLSDGIKGYIGTGYDGNTWRNDFWEYTPAGVLTFFYRDADGDGYGDVAVKTQASTAPAGYVLDSTDCNDANAAIHPGATEVCNGIDDNCNGVVDEGFTDTDGDHIADCVDPDDDNDGVADFKDCAPLDRTNDKVLICHNGHIICISQSAVPAHLRHGDTEGPCNSNELINPKKRPSSFRIYNYPNPFTGTTTITYELPEDCKVSIKIYDVLGKVVTTLVDANKKLGVYTVNFESSPTKSRTLLYCRLIATTKSGQVQEVNKMIQIH